MNIDDIKKEAPNTYTLLTSFESWQNARMCLATLCFSALLSPRPLVVGVFGRSGSGKTTIQRSVLKVLEKRTGMKIYDFGKGAFTIAGLSRMFERRHNDEEISKRVDDLSKADIIFLEDLSELTTTYMTDITVSLLTDFSESKSIEYTTVESLHRIEIEKLKTCFLGGTEKHYQRLVDSEVWTSKLKRRLLPLFLYYLPNEYADIQTYVINAVKTTENVYVDSYAEMFDSLEDFSTDPVSFELTDETKNQYVALQRYLYDVLGDHFSAMLISDGVASGHARFNGRNVVKAVDYYVLNKLFSRFVLPFSSGNELFLFDEILRRNSLISLNEAKCMLNIGDKSLIRLISLSKVLSTKNYNVGIKLSERFRDYMNFMVEVKL